LRGMIESSRGQYKQHGARHAENAYASLEFRMEGKRHKNDLSAQPSARELDATCDDH